MKLSVEELYNLATDRPLSTPEIHSPNDFYGHATTLKKYAGLPEEYQIKAVIEHGAYGGTGHAWDVEVNAPLPSLFSFASARHLILKKRTNKALFSIGPMLSYAPHFLDADALNLEKRRLGKNLLVLPAHSTHWIDANYDIHDYCKFLEKLEKDFDSIRICLGWKDVLRGQAEEYMRYGFECVTAGHMYDPLFLSRLKSIIELSTITVSFKLGTHIGYCILLGRPHYISKLKHQYTAANNDILRRDVHDPIKTPYGQEMIHTFGELRDDISFQQKELVERYWGLNEHKTVNEMRLILQATEDMYKKGRNFYISGKDVLTEQALDYLNLNDNEKALLLMNQSIAVNSDMPGLNYGKAVALARLGNTNEAIETLNNLPTVLPGHKKAKLLLKELRIAKGMKSK